MLYPFSSSGNLNPSLVSETITANNISPAPIIVLIDNDSFNNKIAKIGANSDSVANNIDALVDVVFFWQYVCKKKHTAVAKIDMYNIDTNDIHFNICIFSVLLKIINAINEYADANPICITFSFIGSLFVDKNPVNAI